MKIEYLGHSSFLLTTSSGVRILTDPLDGSAYPDPYLLSYKPFNGDVDIITVSHSHPDHSAVDLIASKKVVVRDCAEYSYQGIVVSGVETAHDDSHGSKRGRNIVFVMQADGIRVAHLGDLGHVLTPFQQNEIGNVDVAMIPVGGYYTINALQAHMVAKQLKAHMVIPMHYKTAKCNFTIDSVDEFTHGHKNVIVEGASSVIVNPENLPSSPQIILLDYSG